MRSTAATPLLLQSSSILRTINGFFTSFPTFRSPRRPKMHRDPVTWSREERIARCREQAASFQRMAEANSRFIARDLLIELARQFNSLADGLQKHPHDPLKSE